MERTSEHRREKVVIPAVSRDEEGRKRMEKIEVDSGNVETIRYVEKKLTDKGVHRMDRHPRDGLPIGRQPKGGHGGKYTWEGPLGLENEEDVESIPVALDKNDPNYVEEEEGEEVVGRVEVAKVAQGSEGVARLEIRSIKVMKADGEILEYQAPMKVHQLLAEYAGHAVSKTMPVVKPLQPDDDMLSVMSKKSAGVLRIKLVIRKDELELMLRKGGDSVSDMVYQIQKIQRAKTVDKLDREGPENCKSWKPVLQSIPEVNQFL
ncbi:hypothetical protein ACET3Z_009324 [Daucus carota]